MSYRNYCEVDVLKGKTLSSVSVAINAVVIVTCIIMYFKD